MYQELERATPIHPWMDDASCRDDPDPDLWFRATDMNHFTDRDTAVSICSLCPVQTQCLNYAITEELTYGVFGGLMPDQRRKLQQLMKRN